MMVLVFALNIGGCGRNAAAPVQSDTARSETVSEQAVTESTIDLSEALISEDSGQEISDEYSGEDTSYPDDDIATIDEDGIYDSKEDVALYLHIYDKLPSNYITKKEAKKLGWSGGSVEDYAPGMCIGGDYFGNYERLLPEDQDYHECDIGTLGKSSRGAKRIIYSDEGYIYYTEDHYESFELLYEP